MMIVKKKIVKIPSSALLLLGKATAAPEGFYQRKQGEHYKCVEEIYSEDIYSIKKDICW